MLLCLPSLYRSKGHRPCIFKRLDQLKYFDIIGNMEMIEALAALSALAHESRLMIFRLLIQAGPHGLPAGRIAQQLNLPAATLTFHLKALKHAGLATSTRDGRSLIYAAAYPTMNGLLAYLTENCCQGDAMSCRLDIPSCSPATTRRMT